MSDSDDYELSDDSAIQEESDGEGSIRNDLAQTTFEELLSMKDKLGTKIYRESVLKKLSGKNVKEDDDEETEDLPVTRNFKHKSAPKFRPKPSIPPRSSKSNPIIASSKRLDTRHNFTIIPAPSASTGPTFRDPRFESQCGTFQVDRFEDNYRFLNSMKKRELETLKKQLKRCKDAEVKGKLIKSIQVLKSQLRADVQKEKAKQVEKKVKTNVALDLNLVPKEPTVHVAPKSTQKPKVFVNKATLKRAQLAEKFKELKKTGKLDKYIERKRKKNAGKERKYLDQGSLHSQRI